MIQATPAPSGTIIIFGAVGDLTKRLLMPSIFNLHNQGLLNADTKIIGADHNDCNTDGWRQELGAALREFATAKGSESSEKVPEKAWDQLAQKLEYVKLDFTSDEDYQKLADKLKSAGNILFYFAVSPRFFGTIAEGLHKVGLTTERDQAFRRIVIEKPFGRDLASAKQLNSELLSLVSEPQIYRIDHFLGKEAVNGIAPLRFGSRILEPLLSRANIASVQITAAETVGVEERGEFYETTGALRDMVPNHLFSLLTLIAMEPPKSFSADDLRDAKLELLQAIQSLTPERAARGQYAAGTIDSKAVRPYRAEDHVAPDSRTATYAAIDVRIDNDRWRDVPFYIRTGKRMAGHVSTIAFTLRVPTGPLAHLQSGPQLITLGIDPQRGLKQVFSVKRPGVELALGTVTTGFHYDQVFDEPPNIGYEVLLYDALCGEARLFQRADMIEQEWRIVQPVLDAWEKDANAPESYAAGSAGPRSADVLLERNGDHWLAVATLDTLGNELMPKI
jgi:glucose-6-phosphate 1-dehydrogenase